MADKQNWKIRAVGDLTYEIMPMNPTNYSREKVVDVNYEQLLTGGHSRVVSAKSGKQEDVQISWADLGIDEVAALSKFINKKVEIVDHRLEMTVAYIDGMQKKYLISGRNEPRFAVTLMATVL